MKIVVDRSKCIAASNCICAPSEMKKIAMKKFMSG